MAQPPIDDPLNNDKKLAKHIKTLVTPGKTKPRLSALEHLRADLQGNEQEKRNLYTRHYRHIWEVYTGEFLEYTQMMLTLKPKPNEQTVNQLLDLLEECMRYVPAPFQKTTTVEMLHTMSTLRHVLYSKNLKSLRQRGLKIVLNLAIEHPKADSIMDLLMYAFDFNPFLPKWNVVRLKYDHESTKELTTAGPLIPRPAGNVLTKEETIEFMGEFFDFIERQKDFSHWFGVTKKFMLTTLFPDLMRKQQQKPVHDETGFKQCPPELQEALFNRFEQWHKTRYNDIGRELWTKDGNPEVVFELYTHSVSLEPSWRLFQDRIFNFFHRVLIVDPIPLTSKGQQIEFQNAYFSKLVTCLSAHTLVDETVAVAKIMFNIITGTCEKKVWDSLDHSIQCTLQASILDITCTVLALVPSEVRGDKGPDNILCPMLLDSLFHCWVYTQTDDQILPGQWALLQDRIRSTWHRPKALELCFQKVCQISYNLITQHLYLFTYLTTSEERIQKAGKRGNALTPDGRKLAWKKHDPLPSQVPWTLESYVRIWNHLFDIFRLADAATLTHTKSPAISVEVFRCVKQVMYMFIVAEELADFNPTGVYHQFDMIYQFAPWLWRQSQLGDEHQNEKCQVYKALCRLFCRHNQYRYSSLLLSQFYTTIQQGLELNACTVVAYSIIDATVPIFSLALPGANILVPYYLQAISQIFVDSNPPPPRTSERALLCLASLVCYARHFESLDNIAVKGGSTFKFADLKHHLCSIIHFLLERFKGKTEIHISLSMLAVILLEELHSTTPDLNFLAEKSLWICTHISHGMPIPQSALKALETLFLFAHKFEQVDPHLIENIINQVCNAIINTIKDPKPIGDPSETVCAQIETLLVLLLSAPVACFASPQIILLNVTEAASCGIHSPDVKIQECALKLIHNFMNLLHNFPTNGYYDRTSSFLLDETDKNEPLWSNVGDSIFSFYDVLGNNHELGLRESEQLAWIMHCIMYPYSGSVLFRRIAFHFEKYLKIVAPLMVEVWKHSTLISTTEPEERQTIINNMRRLFTTDNPPGVLVPGTTAHLVFETAQDVEDFQKQLMQSLVAHYVGFRSTSAFTSAVETAGRVTCRDPTGSYSWDVEANFDGHPRWQPTPGIVQKLGGPPTRSKFSHQPQFSENFYDEYHTFVNGNPDLSAYYQPVYTPPQPLHPVQPTIFANSGGSPTKGFSNSGLAQPQTSVAQPFGEIDPLGGLGGMGDLDIGSVLDELDSMLDSELHALSDPVKAAGGVDPGAINVLDSADPWAALQTVVGNDQTEWQQLEADLDSQLDNFEGAGLQGFGQPTGTDQEIDQMFSNFGQEAGAPPSSGNTPRGGTPVHNQLNLGAVTQQQQNVTQTQAFVPTQVVAPLVSPFEIPYHRPGTFHSVLAITVQKPLSHDWVEEQDVELDLDYLRPEETNPVRCPKLDLTAPPVTNVCNLETLMRYTTDSVYTYDDEYVEWGTQEFTRIREESQPQIEYILMRMEQQEIKSAKALEAYKHNLPLLDAHPTQPHDPVITSGWLSYEALDDFRLLNNLTPNFKHIKGLDGTNGRECVKIALVYAGYGQQSEKDILGNTLETSGNSFLYHEIVKGLFPLVQKDLHTGYAGGLEKYDPDLVAPVAVPACAQMACVCPSDRITTWAGDYMPYYSTPLLEMVAHECVKFPAGPGKEFESRKRHIGNDIVHVVWSEHVADYNPSTIISQFGSIVIVVYPLANGLFRITIARKADVPNMIGPVVHNMVLRKELVAPLLRQSAFVANQLARTSAGNYEGPFKTRQDKAAIVLDKCCELRKFQEIVARVLSPLPKHIEGLVAKTPRAGGAATTPKGTPGGSLDSARRNF